MAAKRILSALILATWIIFCYASCHSRKTLSNCNKNSTQDIDIRNTMLKNKEAYILMKVKEELQDTLGVLSNWSFGSSSPCLWNGVVCDIRTEKVTGIFIEGSSLNGHFPKSLCKIPFIEGISLFNNNIKGEVPNDLLLCTNLRYLDLSSNYFMGAIPDFLWMLPNIEHVYLSGNLFYGSVPPSLGKMSNLRSLGLAVNKISGPFPAFLGSLKKLEYLSLTYLAFENSSFPAEFQNLRSIRTLYLAKCNLVGEIPDFISSLSTLESLDLSTNMLSGSLPRSITQLRKMTELYIYDNKLSGTLPLENWGNMVSLREVDISNNMISGIIPEGLANLPLSVLSLHDNMFSGSIPEVIAESPNLTDLRLFANNLTGPLPSKLGSLSNLETFDVSGNKLTGELPRDLCKNNTLVVLCVFDNSLSGQIPEEYGNCSSLYRVRMHGNHLSGKVPDALWGLPRLTYLQLNDNNLSQTISSRIGNASFLAEIILSSNKFSGSIPYEIGMVRNLRNIQFDNNSFEGALPRSMARLHSLSYLDLRGNMFSGIIVTEMVHSWRQLVHLDLSNNRFVGLIPDDLGRLNSLTFLDLSYNRFEGRLPATVGKLDLLHFNLSHNNLSGPIPSTFKFKFFNGTLAGNAFLCSDFIEGALPCHFQMRKKSSLGLIKWLLPCLGAFCMALLFIVIYTARRPKKEPETEYPPLELVSFQNISFGVLDILSGLAKEEVIGSGGSGTVYRAFMESAGINVAIKKFWNDNNTDTMFDSEIEILATVRHRNIVKLLCSLSNATCKLVVYEYMENGSLGDVLYSPKVGDLTWPRRLRIALDIAQGLEYLHHYCDPPIIHGDVKSNNILLDADYSAKLGDFGLARILTARNLAESQAALVGSCGYIAPELIRLASTTQKSDVYSFGVVLLEMVCRKSPGDEECEDGDVVKWARKNMVSEEGEKYLLLDSCVVDSRFHLEMMRVVEIALCCTAHTPSSRPSMTRVIHTLHQCCRYPNSLP